MVKSRYLLPLFIAIAAVAIYHSPSLPPETNQNPSYLPKAEYVRYSSLGQTEAFASLFWVSAVLSYGESLITGARYHWLTEVCDIVTTLDPLFKEAYIFAGAAPGVSSKAPKRILVLTRGTETFPGDWRLALYYSIAVVEADSNYALAAKRMQAFANSDTVLPYVRHIYRSYMARSKPRQESLLMYLEDYCNPQYADFRKGLETKMIEALGNVETDADKKEFHVSLSRFLAEPENRPSLFHIMCERWQKK